MSDTNLDQHKLFIRDGRSLVLIRVMLERHGLVSLADLWLARGFGDP